MYEREEKKTTKKVLQIECCIIFHDLIKIFPSKDSNYLMICQLGNLAN